MLESGGFLLTWQKEVTGTKQNKTGKKETNVKSAVGEDVGLSFLSCAAQTLELPPLGEMSRSPF